MSNGLEDFSLFDLFRMEAEEQVRVLQNGLIQLESGAATAATLEALMRAAHSLKGAARIVGLDAIVNLTHVVEDRFVAAQHGRALDAAEVDRMLTATDWLARVQAVPESETEAWFEANAPAIEAFTATFGEEIAQTAACAAAGASRCARCGATVGEFAGCGARGRHLRATCERRAAWPSEAHPHRCRPLRQDHVHGVRGPGRLAHPRRLWNRI